jgi:ABC-2 type transport system permease protein
MTLLTIAGTTLRRLTRDRTGLFFLVLLPVLVILLIGVTVDTGGELRLGVVADRPGPLATELVDGLADAPATATVAFADEAAARTALRRGELDAVVLIPAGFDAALLAGDTVAVPVIGAAAESTRQAAGSAVAGVVAAHAARVQAARFAAEATGGTVEQRLPGVTALQSVLPAVSVDTEVVDATSDYLPTGFGYSAPTQLVLFVFINLVAGGAAIIQCRRLGIYERVVAGPVRPRDIVLGEATAYLCIGLLESALIVGVGAAVFGVGWGDPVAAAALILVWALVGTGAGLLAGTLFRTPEQAGAIGPALGIGLGMLGGTMWPLEIVTPFMQHLGHLSPHAWAVDGWIEILSRGGHLTDIAGPLAVLTGFAVILLTLAGIRLRHRLT